MTEESLLPSEVREKVLAQHREIEEMLAGLESGVSDSGDADASMEQVKRCAYALRGILELHMKFEEEQLVPAVQEADGFGPERARHILSEHEEQRQALDEIVESILSAGSKDQLVDGVEKLAVMLRQDMRQEECSYVNSKLLRDSVIPTDTFGG